MPQIFTAVMEAMYHRIANPGQFIRTQSTSPWDPSRQQKQKCRTDLKDTTGRYKKDMTTLVVYIQQNFANVSISDLDRRSFLSNISSTHVMMEARALDRTRAGHKHT